MQEQYEELYKSVVDAVLLVHPILEETKACKPTSVADLADKLFALRECIKRIEELRRQMSGVEDTVEKLFIAVYLATSQTDMHIKTEYVTAEPVPEVGTRVPRRHEPCYNEFLTFLGIPEEVQNHEVLNVHFPGWCSYYTALQARGEDVPEGLKPFLTEYETSKVKTRKRQSMKGSIDVQEERSRDDHEAGIPRRGNADEASVPF